MRIAVCPGSFDPVTNGHIDIITRASALFDKVIVLAAVNQSKRYRFSAEERLGMIRQTTGHLGNVEADVFSGLLADYIDRSNATAIVKGLRAVSDFEFEFQQAMANKRLNERAETVFLTTAPENMFLSSSLVREVAAFGGDISMFVPEEIRSQIVRRLSYNEITAGVPRT